MATSVVLNKSTNVSPPPSPKPKAKSKSKSPEPRPDSPELAAKPKAEPQPPKPDANERELSLAPSEALSATKSISDQEDIVDMDVLGQILELDEEDNHEFSMGMAGAYFSQAKTTFKDMSEALDAEDLPTLSSLGHFLKGSSAALGILKVQKSCERIQHYGNCRDEEGDADLTRDDALERIRTTVAAVRIEYGEAEQWLRNYYAVNAPDETLPSD